MDKSIEEELRDAQSDSAEPYLEAAAITEAGRTHLQEMIEWNQEEIGRIEALLDNGAINHPNHYGLVETLEAHQEYIRNASAAITDPDERYFEAGLSAVFTDYVEFIYKDHDGTNRIMTTNRDFWAFLGEPQVLKVLR
jgi:hypothetical protein